MRLLVLPSPRSPALLLIGLSLGACHASTSPTQIPAAPADRCRVAHDHVLALVDDAVPEDEEEVHDLIAQVGQKDTPAWVKICMEDQAKNAACAIRAGTFAAVDACNGAAVENARSLPVGIGECEALMAHMTDVATSVGSGGLELDTEVRQQIRERVEQTITATDLEACNRLSHAEIGCFLDGHDVRAFEACDAHLADRSPPFVSQILALASGNAPKSTGRVPSTPPAVNRP